MNDDAATERCALGVLGDRHAFFAIDEAGRLAGSQGDLRACLRLSTAPTVGEPVLPLLPDNVRDAVGLAALGERRIVVVHHEGRTYEHEIGPGDPPGHVVVAAHDIGCWWEAHRGQLARDRVLEAVSNTFHEFLETSDPGGLIRSLLRQLGTGTESTLIHLLELRPGRELVHRHGWHRGGAVDEAPRHLSTRLALLLEGSRSLHSLGRRLPEAERGDLRVGEGDVVLVPIHAHEATWGILHIEREATRRYTQLEVDAFQVASRVIGSAIERGRSSPADHAGESLYRRVLEQVNDVVFALDRDGAIVFVSGTVERATGYNPGELRGRRLAELAVDEHKERADWVVASIVDGAAVATPVELELVSRNRDLVVVEVSAAALRDGDDTVSGVLGVARDVTERRRMSRELEAVAKLEAVGKLASGIAHDFGNLLMAVEWQCDHVLRHLDPKPTTRQEVEAILEQVRRGSDLTRQLLAFGRRQVMRPETMDVGVLLDELHRMLSRLIGEDIRLTFAAEEGAWVSADPAQLERVIVNLALNAREAMNTGGTLALAVRRTTADEVRRWAPVRAPVSDWIVLEVTDDGCGMDAETRGRVFEPFFSARRGGQGTGLGLATVYGIIKQLNGFIFVESEVDEGTTFRIYLPEVVAPGEQRQPSKRPILPVGSGVVLIAEDDPELRRTIRRILVGLGYEVLAAESGQAALDLAMEVNHVDLLLADVVMPGMSGPELADEVLARWPGAKVLLMSGYPAQSAHRSSREHQALPLLQKPFRSETLAFCVRELIEPDEPSSAPAPTAYDSRTSHTRPTPMIPDAS